MTEDEWILHHHLKEDTDPEDEEDSETIPPIPIIENPGYFVVKPTWTVETTILRKREEYSEQLQLFLWKTNIEQVINLELTDAIPKSFLSDYTNVESTLAANIKLILDHMEETYDKIRPKDINNIMKTFYVEFDGTTTVSTYFDRQQGCKKLLRTTIQRNPS